jgi:hypothetical protein
MVWCFLSRGTVSVSRGRSHEPELFTHTLSLPYVLGKGKGSPFLSDDMVPLPILFSPELVFHEPETQTQGLHTPLLALLAVHIAQFKQDLVIVFPDQLYGQLWKEDGKKPQKALHENVREVRRVVW